jgi:antagonist of KipI
MSLRVLQPGLCTLLVDQGRPSTRGLGVPVGGAADRSAFAIGNAVLGNYNDAAALEITLVGPSLLALDRIGGVLLGAPFQVHSSRQALAPNKLFTLEPGEEIHIGGAPVGARAYLCVVGGFQTPAVLGSRSALAPVAVGTELACSTSTVPSCLVGGAWPWSLLPALSLELHTGRHQLRIIDGPQRDWFHDVASPMPAALENWGSFAVRPASNRMGLRLQGRPLPVPARELVSEPVCPGSIQITRDGQAIVLGVDGQTIGGYPKIAQVISGDLDALAQLRPGTKVSFAKVLLAEAQELERKRQHQLVHWCRRLRLAVALR